MPRTSSDTTVSKTKTTASGQMKNSRFHKLFVEELKDIYWAEKHLVNALPKMIRGATTEELKSAIEEHLEETKNHVARLEEVFESIGMKASAKKCEAMSGLIEEGKEILEETDEDSMTRDAAIIIAAQKIEHYEIASYGSLVELARKMGHDKASEALRSTLREEKAADEKLTSIATAYINDEALAE